VRAPETAEAAPAGRLAELIAQAWALVCRGASALVARPYLTLGGIVVAHWLALIAFAATVRRNGWLFYQGGDQIWLTTGGWLLGQGELPPTYVGYGWSLVLAPITLVTGPSFVAAMPAVTLFNVLVLAPLALVAVYAFASRIAGRGYGLIAAALWVAMPFAVIPLWRADYHERYVEQFLPQALGLNGLADYPSMVLLLVGAWLFVRALENRAWPDAAAAGVVVGFAIATKPSNAIFLAAPAAAVLLARNLRPVLPFALALVPALLTLTLWKQRGLGTIPVLAYDETRLAAGSGVAAVAALDLGRYVDLDWATLHDNMDSLREYFWSARLLQWAPVAGAIGVARRSAPLAGFVAVWFGTFLLLKGSTPFSTVASGSFFRFLLPAFPAYFLLVVSIPLLVPTLARRLAPRTPASAPLGRPLLAGLAVALVAVPAVAIAAATPTGLPLKAVKVNSILTPVDPEIAVDVRSVGEARILTWTHPDPGPTDVFYRVYRTAAGGPDVECADDGEGAADCTLAMLQLGTTREARWRDGSPPAGSLYRIGVAANSRDDPDEGDVATISEPLPAG
jgi:hypothetical protein